MKNHTTIKFKTNINCSACIETAKPHLNKALGAGNWEVDTTNKDKILTVKPTAITEQEIVHAVETAGFKISLLK